MKGLCVCAANLLPRSLNTFDHARQIEIPNVRQTQNSISDAGPARLVRGACPGSAVAADAGTLCHLGFGDHAATDAGEDGDSVLESLAAGVAGYCGPRGGAAGEDS